MNTLLRFCRLTGVAVLFMMSSSATTPRTFTFEGLADGSPVGQHYAAMGVTFAGATASVGGDSADDFAGEPSASTAAFSINGIVINVPAGMTGSVSLYYSNPGGATSIRIFSEIDMRGSILADAFGASTPPDGGHRFGTFAYFSVPFEGKARSIAIFSRGPGGFYIDDVTLTAVQPGRSWFLSDVSFTSVKNGFGPPEKDRSNGQENASDGYTLALGGTTYAKGLGVHAESELRFYLGGGCSTFSADVGLDDETRGNGSVVFQVWADGLQLFDSGPMSGNAPAINVSLDVSGKHDLVLIVDDGGDGIDYDHADWAGARVTCIYPPGSPPALNPSVQ